MQEATTEESVGSKGRIGDTVPAKSLAWGFKNVFTAMNGLQSLPAATNAGPAAEEVSAHGAWQSVNLVTSLAVSQAATRIKHAPSNHKLSLKVTCGSGKVCLYHCGGKILYAPNDRSTAIDETLARWECFLGDPACAPLENQSGNRQTMAQIATIEHLAAAGEVIVSSEMVQALQPEACRVILFKQERAAKLYSLCCPLDAGMKHRKVSSELQLPSHVAARAAALFRMHVVDNVRQRIEAGHFEFISEIRHLTILFMGFPSLKTPNSQLAHRLEPVQETVMTVIRVMHAFEGSFVQFRCDEKGFLAICAFGLPGASHANNSERGILAALQVQLHVEKCGHSFACGVTTGDLLCACVGSAVRSEYTMFGDAINLSARLMCKAKDGLGSILVDSETMHHSRSKAEYIELEPLTLKGKGNRVKVCLCLASCQG